MAAPRSLGASRLDQCHAGMVLPEQAQRFRPTACHDAAQIGEQRCECCDPSVAMIDEQDGDIIAQGGTINGSPAKSMVGSEETNSEGMNNFRVREKLLVTTLR